MFIQKLRIMRLVYTGNAVQYTQLQTSVCEGSQSEDSWLKGGGTKLLV